MSRTFKDRKEEKAQRRNREPEFKRSYRAAIESGFHDEGDFETCPECGAQLAFERGYFSCDDCGWGSYFPVEKNENADLEFSDVA